MAVFKGLLVAAEDYRYLMYCCECRTVFVKIQCVNDIVPAIRHGAELGSFNPIMSANDFQRIFVYFVKGHLRISILYVIARHTATSM